MSLSAYPNPFNPTATVEVEGQKGVLLRVEVMDLMGHSLQTLYDGTSPESGIKRLSLDGTNLASGSYFVRAQSGRMIVTRKVQLTK